MPDKTYLSLDDWRQLKKVGEEVPEDTIITCALTPMIKAVDEKKRTVEFVISDEGTDRDDDTIAVEGWDLDHYRENPVVLFGHQNQAQSGVVPVIGRALEVGVATVGGDRVLRALDEFMPSDLSEFADTVFRMVAGGWLKAVSVGFRALKYAYVEDRGSYGGFDILRQELFEHSVVPVGSNPRALAIRAKEAGINTAPLVEWCEKFLDHEKGGVHLWLPREAVEAQRAAIKDASAPVVVSFNGNPVTLRTHDYLPLTNPPNPDCDRAKEASTNDVNMEIISIEYVDDLKLYSSLQEEELTEPAEEEKAQELDTEEPQGDTEEAMTLELTIPDEIAKRIRSGELGELRVSFEPTDPPTNISEDEHLTIFLDEEPETFTLEIEGVDSPEGLAALVADVISKQVDQHRMARTGRLPKEV
jgi:hypothetical protein